MKALSAPQLLLTVALPFSAMAIGQQSDFATITNLWYNGYKTNVLAIAEQRLLEDTNDLAGLILKMEYDFAFINLPSISNDMMSVMSVTTSMTNATIAAHRNEIQDELTLMLSLLKDIYRPTPQELEADRAKALTIHKRMNFEHYLKWLHDDGLF